MPRLHDTEYRESVKKRIQALTPEASPRWGKMSVDQMLWHVNAALEASLGRVPYEVQKGRLPAALMRFMVLNGPWPKGRTPTLPQFEARSRHEFEAERSRCLRLIDDFAAKPLASEWPLHPLLGRSDGEFQTRLHGRHFAHHLEQFS